LEGKGRILKKKKEGGSGGNKGLREGRALGSLFFFIIQNPLIWEDSNNLLEDKFFKAIPYCYNTLQLKIY